MMSRGRRLRLYVQLPCFAAAIALLWPMPLWKEAPKAFVQISPFAAICSALALRTAGIAIAIGWIFALIAITKPRWFCRYVCPAGLLLEGASHIGLRKTSWWKRCPPIGRYAALLTAFGALAGYPVLLWMDPLAIFSSYFAVHTAGDVLSGFFAGILLAILIFLSLTSGSIWCTRLCPLGGTLDLLAAATSVRIKSRAHREATDVSSASGGHFRLLRRTFLLGAAGLGLGLLGRKLGAMRGENAPLRPPGAVREPRFAGLCVRCGNCIRACPSKILHPDTGEAGLAGFMAPVVRFGNGYCLEDCLACTGVCPSGALQSLDLPAKRKFVIGEALVDGSLCLTALGKKDCDACVRACPYKAVRIFWDEEQYIAYPLVDFKKCIGCGACEVICPVVDIKAIQVWKRAD